jgi:hypothetical protein
VTAECKRCQGESHKNGGYCGRCVKDLCDDLAAIGKLWEEVCGDDKGVFMRDLAWLHQMTEGDRKRKAPKDQGFI